MYVAVVMCLHLCGELLSVACMGLFRNTQMANNTSSILLTASGLIASGFLRYQKKIVYNLWLWSLIYILFFLFISHVIPHKRLLLKYIVWVCMCLYIEHEMQIEPKAISAWHVEEMTDLCITVMNAVEKVVKS